MATDKHHDILKSDRVGLTNEAIAVGVDRRYK